MQDISFFSSVFIWSRRREQNPKGAAPASRVGSPPAACSPGGPGVTKGPQRQDAPFLRAVVLGLPEKPPSAGCVSVCADRHIYGRVWPTPSTVKAEICRLPPAGWTPGKTSGHVKSWRPEAGGRRRSTSQPNGQADGIQPSAFWPAAG